MATSASRTIQSMPVTNKFIENSDNTYEIRKNTKNFKNFSYFLGGIDVTHQNLDQFTPYIPGVSRIFMHKPPLYMLHAFPEETKNFKTLIETGFKQIGGISNIDVNFSDFTGGFNAQSFRTVSSAQDTTESLTISVYELTGSPVREYLDTWITGVRDIRSGIAHYHGVIEEKFRLGEKFYYGEINHTAEFIYCTYDPTGLNPEYCCMFAHCFPRSVPKDHLNYDSGNRDGVSMDMEFNATKYESPAVNEIGVWYTMNSKVKWNYLDFDPEVNNTGIMGTAGTYTYDYGNNTGVAGSASGGKELQPNWYNKNTNKSVYANANL